VAEDFEFDVDAAADFCHFLEGYFAGKDDAGCAHVFPCFDGAPVGRTCLCGNVDGQVRCDFAAELEYAEVGDEGCVYVDFLQVLQVAVKADEVFVSRDDVHGDVDFASHGACVFDGFFHFFRGEVAAVRAQSEYFARQINGIGSVKKGHFHFFHCSRRCEKFHFFHRLPLYIFR